MAGGRVGSGSRDWVAMTVRTVYTITHPPTHTHAHTYAHTHTHTHTRTQWHIIFTQRVTAVLQWGSVSTHGHTLAANGSKVDYVNNFSLSNYNCFCYTLNCDYIRRTHAVYVA